MSGSTNPEQRVCTEDDCLGEQVTYVRPALDAYCSQHPSNRRLCGETVLANALTYDRKNTNSAQQNTASTPIQLMEGQSVHISTCNQPGAVSSDWSVLRLYNPNNTLVAYSDRGYFNYCGYILYTVPAGGGGSYRIEAGCMASKSCRGTAVWNVGASAYAATHTNDGTRGTTSWKFALTQGQRLDVGTCGLTGSHANGNTFLRLYDAQGNQVALSDNECGGFGSRVRYTAPKNGVYELRAGCSMNTSCGGIVAWSTSGGAASSPFTASNTTNATQNAPSFFIILSENQKLTLGTCGLPSAYTPNDTYLRLFSPNGLEVTGNDDSCGGYGSHFTYTVPLGAGGTYRVRAGCYDNTACDGTLAYATE